MENKKELKNRLEAYKAKHGTMPTKRSVGITTHNQCKKVFGSWSLALYETFGKVNRNFPWDKELVLLRIQDLQTELGRTPLSSDSWGLTSAAQKYFGQSKRKSESHRSFIAA